MCYAYDNTDGLWVPYRGEYFSGDFVVFMYFSYIYIYIYNLSVFFRLFLLPHNPNYPVIFCITVFQEQLHPITLQWRHNERDGVSNHQPYDCLLSRLYRPKKISKLRVTGLCEGNSSVTSEYPLNVLIYPCIDPSHKSDKYRTMHRFVTEMCTHVHISVTEWCIVAYRTGALWNWSIIDHVRYLGRPVTLHKGCGLKTTPCPDICSSSAHISHMTSSNANSILSYQQIWRMTRLFHSLRHITVRLCSAEGLSVELHKLWKFKRVTRAHNALQLTNHSVQVRNPPTYIWIRRTYTGPHQPIINVSFPNNSPIATRLGLCNSLIDARPWDEFNGQQPYITMLWHLSTPGGHRSFKVHQSGQLKIPGPRSSLIS